MRIRKRRRRETISIRKYNVTPQLPANGLTAVEFYAGGGLQSVGLRASGFKILAAYEWNKGACDVYKHNHGNSYIQQCDISTLRASKIPDADTYILSPPCQTWSIAGDQAGLGDARGRHMLRSIAILSVKRPPTFWIENVKGMLNKKFDKAFSRFIKRLERYYSISYKLINSWDYGVAQQRERVFIVGVRKDIGFTFEFPVPSAAEYRTQTLRDAIGDLPEPEMQDNGMFYMPKRLYDYDQSNRVMSWSDPCNTIPAHHNTGQPTHPDRNPGRFTIRETLRIQSVPDWYRLPDGMALGPQYRIVGNGVASRVSYVLGVALAEQLNAVLTQDLREAA